MKVYDRYGEGQPWSWVEENYGPLVVSPLNGAGWKVKELRENANLEGKNAEAAAVIIVKCLDQFGLPVDQLQVAWYWPDVRLDPNCGPANGVPAGMEPGRAEHGPTNLNGDVGWAMGSGAYYSPPNIGPHACWIYGHAIHSQVVLGLGMLDGTDHYHTDVVYQWMDEQPPSPPPPADDIEEHLQAIEALAADILLEAGEIRSLLP